MCCGMGAHSHSRGGDCGRGTKTIHFQVLWREFWMYLWQNLFLMSVDEIGCRLNEVLFLVLWWQLGKKCFQLSVCQVWLLSLFFPTSKLAFLIWTVRMSHHMHFIYKPTFLYFQNHAVSLLCFFPFNWERLGLTLNPPNPIVLLDLIRVDLELSSNK